MEILIATLVIGAIGLIIGIALIKAEEAFHVEVDNTEAEIRSRLPGSNCGGCGYAGCDALAAAIAKGEAPANACKAGGPSVAAAIAELLGVEAEESEKMVAFVKCAGTCAHTTQVGNYVGVTDCKTAAASVPGGSGKSCIYGCMGFGSCVKACQFGAIKVVDGVAVVDKSKCVGCGACSKACPQHLIELIPASAPYATQCANPEKGPTVKKNCTAGCIGCTLCTKKCPNGAISMVGNVSKIDYEKCVGCGACAEKCPAGIIRQH